MNQQRKRNNWWGFSQRKRGPGRSAKFRPPKVRIFEHLEERQMLSIEPIIATAAPGNRQANLDRAVDIAFQNAANLSNYSAAQLENATRWVVRGNGAINAGNFFSETGLVRASTYSPINNTFFAYAGNQTSSQIVASLGGNSSIQYFYPEVAIDAEQFSLPNDPLIREQWNLRSTGQRISRPNEVNNFTAWGADLRVEEAWKIATGEGVTVGVVDDGLFFPHPDLIDNYDPSLGFDAEDGDNVPLPDDTGQDLHGTAVAGIIGARGDNNIGVSGVAPDVTLGGLRLPFSDLLGGTFTDENIARAITHMNNVFDIKNNSWGTSLGRAITSSGPMQIQALIDSAFLGRGGLGTILVNASGNGAEIFDSAGHDDFSSRLYTISVSGYGPSDQFATYAEGGPSVFVTAPTGQNPPGTGIYTTDLPGDLGFNAAGTDNDPAGADFLELTDYTSGFNGTSASAPAAAGVIALMIGAARDNGIELSLRDVKYILAASSRRIDPTDFGGNDLGGWQTNARPLFYDPLDAGGVPVGALDPTYPGVSGIAPTTDVQFAVATNGAGFYVHDGFDYGYGQGAVDARLAVEMARTWQTVGRQTDTEVISALLPIDILIPAGETVEFGDAEIVIPGGVGGEAGFEDYFDLWLNPPDDLPDDLPENTRGGSIPIVVPANYSIEEIEITLEIQIDSAASDRLRMTLISPDGVYSELTNWVKPPSVIGPLTTTGTILHTFTTNRNWGERTEGVGRENPVTGERIEPNVIRDANGVVTAGIWQLVFENWSPEDATLSGGSVDFQVVRTPVNGFLGSNLGGRIQGSIGLDTNQDGVFNTSGVIADILDVDGELVVVRDAAAGTSASVLETDFEPLVSEVIVWVDLDKDGVRDENEPYKMTGADGNYYFDLPWNGDATLGNVGFDYDVRFELPAGYNNIGAAVQTFRLGVQDDGNAATDDPVISTFFDSNFLLEPQPIIFEGNVFADFNLDGTQGSGENTVEEFRVFIDINENGRLDYIDNNGNLRFDNGIDTPLEPMQVTGPDGSFSVELSTDQNLQTDFFGNTLFFNDFYQGKEYYTLMLDARDGWEPTGLDVTAEGFAPVGLGGEQSPSLGFYRTFARPGETLTDINFGAAPDAGSISGFVFNDLNTNGVRDAGETGLAGFTVVLDLDQSGGLTAGDQSILTGTNGNYLFENLPAGTYDILIETLGPGFVLADQTSPLGGLHNDRVLADGAALGNGLVDFGFFDADSTGPAARDFGDLGAPYATTSVDGGPSHGIVAGFFLGAGVTDELDGQPGAGAVLDGSDDGVAIIGAIQAGSTVGINVTASTNLLFLQGWIDFNNDGDFDDEGEHLVFRNSAGVPLPFSRQTRLEMGLNELTIVVPDSVDATTVAARFRYGEGGGAQFNKPNGAAILGEVEDYVLPSVISALFTEPLAGDFDGNDVVDRADYTVWRSTFGDTLDLRADGNANGRIDAADYTIWRNNLGATAIASLVIASPPATSLAVATPSPEPEASLGLALSSEPTALAFVTIADGQLAQYQPTTTATTLAPTEGGLVLGEATAVTPAAVDQALDGVFSEVGEEDSLEWLLGNEDDRQEDEALAVALEEEFPTAI